MKSDMRIRDSFLVLIITTFHSVSSDDIINDRHASTSVEGTTVTEGHGYLEDAFTYLTEETEPYDASALVTSASGSVTEDTAFVVMTGSSALINESARNPNQKSCDRWAWNALRWGISNCIQIVISIFGITGNLLVILVLAKRREGLRSMDILVGALAIADFVSSLFIIPIPTSKLLPNTPLGIFYCKMIDSLYFLFHGLCTSSYILIAMGVERFVAVSNPLNHMLIFSPRRIKTAILLLWLAGILSALFIPFVFELTPQCTCLYRAVPSVVLPIGVFNYFVSVVFPVSTLLLTQTLTAYSLHRQRLIAKKAQIQKTHKPTFHVVARNRVLKLMLVVVSCYIICVTPNQTAYLLLNLRVLPISYVWSPLSSGLINLMFLNSCANPIIYTIRYPPFRKAVKELFCGTSASSQNTTLFGHKSESVKSTYVEDSVSNVSKKV